MASMRWRSEVLALEVPKALAVSEAAIQSSVDREVPVVARELPSCVR